MSPVFPSIGQTTRVRRPGRARAVIAAVCAFAIALGLSFQWVRSHWMIDNALIPLGRYTRVEAASGRGRIIFAGTRSDTGMREAPFVQTRPMSSATSPAALLHRSRILYYGHFARGFAGFFWETRTRHDAHANPGGGTKVLLVAVPYWALVMLSAGTASWFGRIWWLRRTGRGW